MYCLVGFCIFRLLDRLFIVVNAKIAFWDGGVERRNSKDLSCADEHGWMTVTWLQVGLDGPRRGNLQTPK